MNSRNVADLLALAHVSAVRGLRNNDSALLESAAELAMRALTHDDARPFFASLQEALADTYDNVADHSEDNADDNKKENVNETKDDDLAPPAFKPDENPKVDDPVAAPKDLVDGTVKTSAPVDAGSVPHDGLIEDEDIKHSERLGLGNNTKPKESAFAAILRNLRG